MFGTQGLITIITMTFLQKIAKYYSLGRWLLLDLIYYLHPNDEELKRAAGLSHGKDSNNKHKGVRHRNKHSNKDSNEAPEPFNIPRSTEISLETSTIKPTDLPILRFYPEFEWLLNFSLCTVVVYALTELYINFVIPKNELNLSMIWVLLSVCFCIHNLFSMVKLYFQTDDGGEMAIVIVFGFSFFVLAMIVLILDENLLELGLEAAYTNFSSNAQQFLQNQGIEDAPFMSKMTFKMILALIGSLFGAFLAWPGIRLAKMHRDAIRYRQDSPMTRLLIHFNLFSPLLIVVLWIKPAVRDVLVEGRLLRNKGSLMTDATFETLRVYIVLIICFLRFCLMRQYLQSYLNLAFQRSQELRKEAGKILNTEYQKIIARVYYYMVVVALQYMIPVLLLFFVTCLYKTLGNLNWGVYGANADAVIETNTTSVDTSLLEDIDSETVTALPPLPVQNDPVSEKVSQLSAAVSSLTSVFGPVFMRGVFSFATWWMSFVMFVTSGFGVVYYEYFSQSMTGN